MPFLAIGAVDLVALVAALMILLLLLAGNQLAKLLSTALRTSTSFIPGVRTVGETVAGIIDAGTAVAVAALRATWDPKVTWAAHAIWGVAAGPWHWVYKVTSAIVSLFDQLAGLAQKVAQLAVSTFALVAEEVTRVEDLVYGWVLNAIAVAEAYAAQVASDAIHVAEHLYNVVVADLSSVAATLVGYIDDAYNRAIAYAFSLLAVAERFATAAADDVRSEAVTLFGFAEDAIGAVESEVQAIEGEITGIQTELDPLIGALPLIATIPALAALLQTVTADVTECLDPLCDTVTPTPTNWGTSGTC